MRPKSIVTWVRPASLWKLDHCAKLRGLIHSVFHTGQNVSRSAAGYLHGASGAYSEESVPYISAFRNLLPASGRSIIQRTAACASMLTRFRCFERPEYSDELPDRPHPKAPRDTSHLALRAQTVQNPIISVWTYTLGGKPGRPCISANYAH